MPATIRHLPLLILVLAAGCSDDDPVVAPTEFAVTIEVTDPTGAPVAGLELGLAPDSPHYMDGKCAGASGVPATEQLELPYPNPFFPSVTFVIALDEPRSVRLTVEDVEGGLVQVLDDRVRPAGRNAFMWNGRSAENDSIPSGVYRIRLVLRDEADGAVVLDEARSVLMAAFYPDQYLAGTTDDDGRIVLTDRRLFPYLHQVPDFPATDETGEQTGTISLTAVTRFYLVDPGTDQVMRFDGEIDGPTTLEFTWDPAP